MELRIRFSAARLPSFSSTGLSLMPEGFEKRVSKPEMADLIAFRVLSSRRR